MEIKGLSDMTKYRVKGRDIDINNTRRGRVIVSTVIIANTADDAKEAAKIEYSYLYHRMVWEAKAIGGYQTERVVQYEQ